MAGQDKALEKTITGFLELKNNNGMSDQNFLLMLGMVNLMEILSLIEVRSPGSVKSEGPRRAVTPADAGPFIGMFGGPKFKHQNEN